MRSLREVHALCDCKQNARRPLNPSARFPEAHPDDGPQHEVQQAERQRRLRQRLARSAASFGTPKRRMKANLKLEQVGLLACCESKVGQYQARDSRLACLRGGIAGGFLCRGMGACHRGCSKCAALHGRELL